jgi:hypothetical protein
MGSLPGGTGDICAPTTHHATVTRSAPVVTAAVSVVRQILSHRPRAVILVGDYDFPLDRLNVRPSTTTSRFPADPTLILAVNLTFPRCRLAFTATDGISPPTHFTRHPY